MSHPTFNSSYPTNGDAVWYLLKTKTQAEELALNSLKHYQITAYLPKLLTSRAKSQELKEVPLFPGYLFFQLPKDSRYWPYVRWAPGVSYILSDEYSPISLPEELVREIASREVHKHRAILTQLSQPFAPGENLEVVSGPFAGLEAVFEQVLSASCRVQVLIQILGRLTRVNLESGAVKRPIALLGQE